MAEIFSPGTNAFAIVASCFQTGRPATFNWNGCEVVLLVELVAAMVNVSSANVASVGVPVNMILSVVALTDTIVAVNPCALQFALLLIVTDEIVPLPAVISAISCSAAGTAVPTVK